MEQPWIALCSTRLVCPSLLAEKWGHILCFDVGASMRTCFALALCASIAGCQASPDASHGGSGGPSSSDDTFASDGGAESAERAADCDAATKLIYVLDTEGLLRGFDPSTEGVKAIGMVTCATAASPYSMTVDRAANAWVVYTDGTLFKVSTKDGSCTSTDFAPNQLGFTTFGIGFATDAEDGKSEALYIAGKGVGLGTIDLSTMKVAKIGPIDATRAELSGTGAGQLFALQEGAAGQPWKISELSKSSGQTISLKLQSIDESQSNFAFAAWGGQFYSWVGTTLFRFDPVTNEAKVLTRSVPFRAVGAGVSTCAPHAVVK